MSAIASALVSAVLAGITALIKMWMTQRQNATNAQDVGRFAAERDAAIKAAETIDAMAQADSGYGNDASGRLRSGTF